MEYSSKSEDDERRGRVCHIHRMGFLTWPEKRNHDSICHVAGRRGFVEPATLLDCLHDGCEMRFNDQQTFALHTNEPHPGYGNARRRKTGAAAMFAITFGSHWPEDLRIRDIAILRRLSLPGCTALQIAAFSTKNHNIMLALRLLSSDPTIAVTSIYQDNAETRFVSYLDDVTMLAVKRKEEVARGPIGTRVLEDAKGYTPDIESYLQRTADPTLVSTGLDGLTCCSALVLEWVKT